jgi:hypothetical protein
MCRNDGNAATVERARLTDVGALAEAVVVRGDAVGATEGMVAVPEAAATNPGDLGTGERIGSPPAAAEAVVAEGASRALGAVPGPAPFSSSHPRRAATKTAIEIDAVRRLGLGRWMSGSTSPLYAVLGALGPRGLRKNTRSTQSGDRHPRVPRRVLGAALLLALVVGGTFAGRLVGLYGPAMASAGGRAATAAPSLVFAAPVPSPSASATPPASTSPLPSVEPESTPTSSPTPIVGPVDINLARNGNLVFSSQITKEMCAPAGLTSALATMGLVKASNTVQRQIEGQIGRWTSYADSHNGGWGPVAMTKALAAYGAPGYVVRTFATRASALRAAGIALSATHEPVLLLAWWGAHTWVMTGYRATGDLVTNPKAVFTGAYVVDPWYPRVSSIWGHVNPPGHFYDMKGLTRNYIAWTRPEGRYPGRDGRWVAVIPTRSLSAIGG